MWDLSNTYNTIIPGILSSLYKIFLLKGLKNEMMVERLNAAPIPHFLTFLANSRHVPNMFQSKLFLVPFRVRSEMCSGAKVFGKTIYVLVYNVPGIVLPFFLHALSQLGGLKVQLTQETLENMSFIITFVFFNNAFLSTGYICFVITDLRVF